MQTTPNAWRLVHDALNDQDVVARYQAKVHTSTGNGCWWWTGALHSRTGHGRFWIGTYPHTNRSGEGARGVSARGVAVISSRFGWALCHGPDALDDAPVLAHTCDEPSCQNPGHLVRSSNAVNHDDWLRRRWSIGSPLRDTRGPAGRARAIREAILAGTSSHEAMLAGASALDRLQLTLWDDPDNLDQLLPASGRHAERTPP